MKNSHVMGDELHQIGGFLAPVLRHIGLCD
jgi:hypothetical protein